MQSAVSQVTVQLVFCHVNFYISAGGGERWERRFASTADEQKKKNLQLFYIKSPDLSSLALSGCSVCECGELVVLIHINSNINTTHHGFYICSLKPYVI